MNVEIRYIVCMSSSTSVGLIQLNSNTIIYNNPVQ